MESLNLPKSAIQAIYDIVKARGGEIRDGTKDGEGTEFTIILLSASA